MIPAQSLGNRLQLVVGGAKHLQVVQFANASRYTFEIQLIVVDVDLLQRRDTCDRRRQRLQLIARHVQKLKFHPRVCKTGHRVSVFHRK